MTVAVNDLIRRAWAAGLVVRQLEPMQCRNSENGCYAIQLWAADGSLWAEGSHEDREKVLWHIANYVEDQTGVRPADLPS